MTVVVSFGPIFGGLCVLAGVAFIIWWTRSKKGLSGVLVWLVLSPMVFGFFVYCVHLAKKILGVE